MKKADIIERLNLVSDFAKNIIKQASVIQSRAVKIDVPDSPSVMGAIHYA